MERTNMLKRSQRNLMSIIRNSAQWQFSANNKHLLATTKCSTALSKFEVVSSRILRYLKVYTRSIVSPSNTNSWHGSTELNTMTFVFFTFTINPCSTQNCWSVSNYCCSPTSNSDIRAKSSTKNNSHTCKSTKASASHYLSSKHLSKASKYSPYNKGLRGQPYFTPCWHLKMEVTPSLRWLMHTVSLAYIVCKHRKKCPSTPRPTNTCHNISRSTISNVFLKSTKQQ